MISKGIYPRTLNYGLSDSSGSYSMSSSTPAQITNLSQAITTSGNPVFVGLVSASGSSPGYFGIDGTTGGDITFLRDSTAIAEILISNQGSDLIKITPSFWHIDTPAAGSYTYKAYTNANVADTIYIYNMKLFVCEIPIITT